MGKRETANGIREVKPVTGYKIQVTGHKLQNSKPRP
jgi:hypothetical protein